MAKSKALTLKKAREAARGGDVEAALLALRGFAEAGDASAAASAAEVLAYLGMWGDLIPLAGQFVADPFSTYAGNVFDDMVRLLGRAAIEAGEWSVVAKLAREAWAKIDAALDRNAQDFPEPKIASVRARLSKILDHLASAADRNDVAACAEPILIFGVVHPASRREDFEAAIAMKINLAPERRLALAIAFRLDDEMRRYYPQLTKPAMFDQSLHVVKAMLRAGDADEAARTLDANWPNWYPCDIAQVAPVAPVTDTLLLPLMSVERRERLIRTPRAGAGR